MIIRDLRHAEEEEVKDVIIAGLKDYFPDYDHFLNPDLNHLYQHYTTGKSKFLVAVYQDQIIATGAIMEASPKIGAVSRMHVRKDFRSKGIGGKILAELEAYAAACGMDKIILETTSTWVKAVNFYLTHGYEVTGVEGGDTFFEKCVS